jgi:uroporphyrinogen decarboxylase
VSAPVVTLERREPDFSALEEVLRGRRIPDRVPVVEGFDREIATELLAGLEGLDFPFIEADRVKNEATARRRVDPAAPLAVSTAPVERTCMERAALFAARMGLDYHLDDRPNDYLLTLIRPKIRLAEDTARLARGSGTHGSTATGGMRGWTEETTGLIASREDFERFPWDVFRLDLERHYLALQSALPHGMKAMLCFNFYETVQDQFLGMTNLAFLLHDDPGLVEAVAERWGTIILDLYRRGIGRSFAGGIFHGDDFGHRTGTHISPVHLRRIFFPWLKRFAEAAHGAGKMFWIHACGNLRDVMPDLIEDVGIDAFHSTQDVIMPVTEFKRRYGDRIAVLGGVDMDKLTRLDEPLLRRYVRGILDACMPGGRYALGSGNGIANYVPIPNVLAMLDEGARWRRG